MSTLVPHAQLGAVEAEARERVEAVEIERRALQQELLERTAEAMALDEENATLRKIAVSASTGSIKVSGAARVGLVVVVAVARRAAGGVIGTPVVVFLLVRSAVGRRRRSLGRAAPARNREARAAVSAERGDAETERHHAQMYGRVVWK